MNPGSALLRERICIRRKHEDVVVDKEWEPWEKLTFKGLRRKGTPARVSLIVFACAKTMVGQAVEDQANVPMPSQPSADVPVTRFIESSALEPDAK